MGECCPFNSYQILVNQSLILYFALVILIYLLLRFSSPIQKQTKYDYSRIIASLVMALLLTLFLVQWKWIFHRSHDAEFV
jgi:glucan phosphoethanolaminetransferase (alkaline phosphatase superfamily)